MDLQPSIKRFLDEGDGDVLTPEAIGIEPLQLSEPQKIYLAAALDCFINHHWVLESRHDYR